MTTFKKISFLITPINFIQISQTSKTTLDLRDQQVVSGFGDIELSCFEKPESSVGSSVACQPLSTMDCRLRTLTFLAVLVSCISIWQFLWVAFLYGSSCELHFLQFMWVTFCFELQAYQQRHNFLYAKPCTTSTSFLSSSLSLSKSRRKTDGNDQTALFT